MDAGVIKNYTIAVQYSHKQFIHLHLNEQRAFEALFDGHAAQFLYLSDENLV
jgi:hypothetical protein